MTPSGATAGLGLLSSASWGASDFAGGIGSRRAPALLVTLTGQIFSFLVLLAVCLALHIAQPGAKLIAYAAVAGFLASLALAMFYTALAMGPMGLTAAVTGLLTALIPVLFSAYKYGLPTPLTGLGLITGCVAIWLITHQPLESRDSANAAVHRKALALGALAGVCFGTQLTLLKFAGEGGALWVMTTSRAAGVASLLLVLLFRHERKKSQGQKAHGYVLIGAFAGSLDTIGVLIYLRASQLGRLDVAAVTSSLYPAFTILLSALILRERPTVRQFAGMALALAAVMLLSA